MTTALYLRLPLALSALLISSLGFATDKPITVDINKDVKLVGSCNPDKSTTIVTNSLPEGKKDFIQTTFDEYTLEVSNQKRKRRAFKDCTFEMDVSLPQGYTIGEVSLQYDGFMTLSAKSRGSVETIVSIPRLTNRPWNNSQYHRTAKSGEFDDDYSSTFVSKWGHLRGQRCPSKVKVFVDILMDLEMSPKAGANETSSIGLDTISGLFKGSKPKIGVVPCHKKPWWWWWFYR